MSITITGQPGQRVAVAGDGSLIEGRLEAEDDRFDFRVVVDGAGLSRVAPGALTLDWTVEWVTIASYDAGAVVARGIAPLPLFDQVAV